MSRRGRRSGGVASIGAMITLAGLALAISLVALLVACGSSKPNAVVATAPPKKNAPVRRGYVLPRPVTTIPAHDAGVSALAFSPDGHFVATGGSDDDTAKLWDLGKQAIVCEMSLSYPVTAVAFSPDAKRLLTASSSVKVTTDGSSTTHGQLLAWTLPTCAASTVFMNDARLLDDAAFSPDGKMVAALESKAHLARLFDANSGAFLRSFPASETGSPTLAFFPDGHTLALGSDDGVDLIDLVSGARRATLEGEASDVVVSPLSSTSGTQGALIVTANGSELRTWDGNGTSLQVIKSLGDVGSVLAFSPDGLHLASGAADGTIKIWDVQRGLLLETLRGHDDDVTALTYARDGSLLGSAGHDGAVLLWSIE